MGNYPGKKGSTQGLDTALDQTHDNGKDIKLRAALHEGGPYGDKEVNCDGNKDCTLGPKFTSKITEPYCRWKADKLSNEESHD